jgi:hypothetical protein
MSSHEPYRACTKPKATIRRLKAMKVIDLDIVVELKLETEESFQVYLWLMLKRFSLG